LNNVVPQPAPDYEPFGFPLAHSICLVTAYSESVEGLRTTLDSLATTDYPNSHKLILVIADGMVKGAGNDKSTPEIVLSMMKEFVIEPEDVEAHSYVAIADGHKRHNMAKVFAGFYYYDDATVEKSKQQRVPVVLVAKTGNPLEASDPKPGNRGKRDSQIVLMAFLQKVMFDERMTTFEYEFFNSLWRVTGVSPDRYEMVLCVDADTKVFPDSLTRMVSCMVQDEEIMGLCGETKIANKGETWVTMIQGRFQQRLFNDFIPQRLLSSLRILHFAPYDQGIRIHVRWCNVLARLFQHVSHQSTERRFWVLGPRSCQPGYCRTLFGERG
jgi:chitin synthase